MPIPIFIAIGAHECVIYRIAIIVTSRYIYVPIMKLWSGQAPFIAKFLASSVAFVYIYVWHGVQSVIMMWAGMNYISVSLESIGEAIGNSPKYQSLEVRVS